MNDLQSERAPPDLAETADASAPLQPVLLGGGKVKETKRQEPGTIGNPAQHLATAPERDFSELDLTFDDRAGSGDQRANQLNMGAIFVAQWQDEQQVLNLGNTNARQLFGKRGTHSTHGRDRALLGPRYCWICCHVSQPVSIRPSVPFAAALRRALSGRDLRQPR